VLSFPKKNKLFTFTLIIIFFYFINSVLLNRNHYTNHLFLIFNEAYEFLNGMSLYKEVYVKYGIGQTLINTASLYIFGDNYFSIYLTANIFYFFSIFFILLICLKLRFNYLESLFLIIILININPKLIMPWANYLAFLPIVLSLYFQLLEDKKINYFLSGTFLALSCLIRETILISALIIFISTFFYCKFKKQGNYIIFYAIGFILPILFFLSYMLISSNYLIWKELILPVYNYEGLNNVGYYIKDTNTTLRKIYIFFLGPFRLLFITLIDTFRHFWVDWILIYTSYVCCMIFIYQEIFKNKFLIERDNKKINFKLTIISIYSIALIIQNLHAVEIFRVSTGSILGILVLNYYLIKILKKNLIKYIAYIIIVVSIYLNSYGTWGHETDNKKFYELSFNNIKSNFNNIFKTEKMNNYVEIKEFGIMNYDSSIHNFFADFKQKCTELVKVKGIKYSINHGNAWELNYYCGTRPAHYYLFPAKKFAEIYKDAKHIKKNNNNNANTIEFFLSDEPYLINYKILQIFNIKDYSLDSFNNNKYLLIAQKN
jgi:hypothetical protein